MLNVLRRLDDRLRVAERPVTIAIAVVATLCLVVGALATVPRLEQAAPSVAAGPTQRLGSEPSARATEAPLPSRSPEASPSDTTPPGPDPAPAADRLTVADDGPAESADPPHAPAVAPPPVTSAQQRFERRYPAHASATQDARDPATLRWAVVIGINEHQGRTRDNLGSRQDAEALAAHLHSLGWRQDHVLLLTDAAATRENIVEAIRWLQRKTDDSSVSVFHYSGHTKQWPGWDRDRDGETTDEALWPSDNDHLTDGEWAALMRPIQGRLWIDIGACEAAGYLDPGVAGPNRIVTFSSAEDEKSYEDPNVSHSIWGWELIVTGIQRGAADLDGDGDVTIEEAANFAVPRAAKRTQSQRYGAQHGGVDDQVDGVFSLRIPAPPPAPEPTEDPSPTPSDEPSPKPCTGICLPGGRG